MQAGETKKSQAILVLISAAYHADTHECPSRSLQPGNTSGFRVIHRLTVTRNNSRTEPSAKLRTHRQRNRRTHTELLYRITIGHCHLLRYVLCRTFRPAIDLPRRRLLRSALTAMLCSCYLELTTENCR